MSGARVAVVSSHAQLGGSERYLEQLLPAIEDLVVDVVALEDGPFVQRLRQTGTQAHVLPTGAGALSLLSAARLLRRRLRRSGATVVHANGVKAAVVSVLATVGRPRPAVLWLKHDFSWDGRLGTAVARRCALVVGVSEAVVAALPPSRRDVVATGLPPAPPVQRDAARAALRAAAGLADDARVLLLVGRLHPVKGHLEALGALPDVLRAAPSARLVVVGADDPTQSAYAARVRGAADADEVRGRVVLLGHREDVRALLPGADVVVVPSVVDDRGMGREGFGLVPVEALAAGTPVVGYADGALPEVLGDCALLVPPGDRSALAAALVRVLHDERLAERLTRCGRERFDEAFAFDRMVQALRTRYLRLSRSG